MPCTLAVETFKWRSNNHHSIMKTCETFGMKNYVEHEMSVEWFLYLIFVRSIELQKQISSNCKPVMYFTHTLLPMYTWSEYIKTHTHSKVKYPTGICYFLTAAVFVELAIFLLVRAFCKWLQYPLLHVNSLQKCWIFPVKAREFFLSRKRFYPIWREREAI